MVITLRPTFRTYAEAEHLAWRENLASVDYVYSVMPSCRYRTALSYKVVGYPRMQVNRLPYRAKQPDLRAADRCVIGVHAGLT